MDTGLLHVGSTAVGSVEIKASEKLTITHSEVEAHETTGNSGISLIVNCVLTLQVGVTAAGSVEIKATPLP
jgi:hypothetical protein